MPRRAVSIGVLVFLAIFPVLGAAAMAAEPEAEARPLLRFVEGRFWRSADVPGTVAEQVVSVDFAALRAPRMRLPLLDGQTYELVRTDLESRGAGDFAWRGQVLDPAGGEEPLGSAILTMKEGSLLGRISVPGASYQIVPAGNGADGGYRLVDVDDTRLEPCAVRRFSSGLTEEVLQRAEPVQVPLLHEAAKAPRVPPTTTLRLLVLYTDDVARRPGGVTTLGSTVQHDVDLANSSFENSKVPVRVELVDLREIDYEETGEPYPDLLWTAYSPQVGNLRREYGATHVVLLVNQMDGACGIGDLMRKDRFLDRTRPFLGSSVVKVTCTGGFTLAHEIGHTLGCEHDPLAGSPLQIALFPHAYGHIVEGSFRTVMAYPNCGHCPTAPHFSNPAIRFGDIPTGIPGRRDNSRVIGSTRAKFTGPQAEGCLPGPNTLCLAGGRFLVELEWYDVDFEAFELRQLGYGRATSLKGTDTTGYFGFRDATDPDVVVRVAGNGNGVAFSYGQLSLMPFDLVVADLQTGAINVYSPQDICGETDPRAFSNAAAPARRGRAAGCRPGPETLCLHGRFQVTVDWRNPGGEGRGGASSVSRVAGAFDFGDGGDPELMVKITPNGKRSFDVFYGVLSDQQYTLTITDTRTGAVKTYDNPAGSYCGGNEVPAF